jgi:hypothetical protein
VGAPINIGDYTLVIFICMTQTGTGARGASRLLAPRSHRKTRALMIQKQNPKAEKCAEKVARQQGVVSWRARASHQTAHAIICKSDDVDANTYRGETATPAPISSIFALRFLRLRVNIGFISNNMAAGGETQSISAICVCACSLRSARTTCKQANSITIICARTMKIPPNPIRAGRPRAFAKCVCDSCRTDSIACSNLLERCERALSPKRYAELYNRNCTTRLASFKPKIEYLQQ